jgi:hypothetical protein
LEFSTPEDLLTCHTEPGPGFAVNDIINTFVAWSEAANTLVVGGIDNGINKKGCDVRMHEINI